MNEPLIERGFAVVGAGTWLFGRAQPAAVRGALTRRSLKGFICPDRGSLSVGELAAGDGSKRAPRTFEDSSGVVRKPPATAFEGASGAVPESANADLERGSAASNARKAGFELSNAGNAGLERGEAAWCSSADRPFLTLIDCGVPVSAVSDKVLLAPASARTGAKLVKVIPLSFARALSVTEFASPADRETVGPSDRQTAGPSDRQTAAWVVMSTRSRTTRVSLDDGESLGVRPEAAVAWTGPRPTGFCPRLRLLDILLPRGPRDLLLHFHGPAIVWIEGSEPRPLRQTGPRKAVF